MNNNPTPPTESLEEIVGTFISLKFDMDTDDFSGGTLERWNNMLQALTRRERQIALEARIDAVQKFYGEFTNKVRARDYEWDCGEEVFNSHLAKLQSELQQLEKVDND